VRDCEVSILSSIAKLLGSGAVLVLVCLLSASSADATVFRDRAAFNAASQNLQTIDFQSSKITDASLEIDGLVFSSIGGLGIDTEQSGNKLLRVQTVGEITRLDVSLPPGTTAVGCDQFTAPMIVSISTGESVNMNPGDASTFVGFVSDQPIQTLTVLLDFPEPTPSAFVDNFSFGLRRSGAPLVPQLLVTTNTARAAALDSVTTHSEPFHVLSAHNFATDGHTRITLFIAGVALEPADLLFVTVKAEDSQQHVFDLPCEATARVKNLNWMSQVTVRVPDALAGAGNVNINVTVRGATSNKALLRID
jgi:hypothetical protein